MALLMNYQDFIDRVNELGFMPYNNILPGLTSLHEETPKNIWYTGNADIDPCCWKERVSGEKKLAYGCLIGGHKGFISARMFSIFYAAYHIETPMEDRWVNGEINETTWKIWNMFENKLTYSTSEIRSVLGVTPKKGGSRVDKSITELQHCYYITISSTAQRLDKTGRPYGSPQNIYEKVLNWVPEDWMNGGDNLPREEARELIIDRVVSIGKNINRDEVKRILFK